MELSVWDGDLEKAKALGKINAALDAGEDPNNYDKDPLLCTAVLYESLHLVKKLIKAKADPNIINNSAIFRSPLSLAIRNNDLNIAKYLIKHKANIEDPNEFDQTPLNQAAEGGYQEMAKLLIQSGANLNSKDFNNNTSLLYSLNWTNLKMTRILLEAGANPHLEIADKPSFLHIAIIQEKPSINRMIDEYQSIHNITAFYRLFII